MKKSILFWELLGMVIVLILGFVFHFAFSWLGEWKPSALFFAVNESVWEHCKIAFWPAFLFSVIEYFFIKERVHNFFVAKAVMLLTLPVMIIVLFYTYTGILGDHIPAVDIGIFFIAVMVGQYLSYRLLLANPFPKWVQRVSVLVILLLTIAFSILTWKPLHIPLFQDPISGGYGIYN